MVGALAFTTEAPHPKFIRNALTLVHPGLNGTLLQSRVRFNPGHLQNVQPLDSTSSGFLTHIAYVRRGRSPRILGGSP